MLVVALCACHCALRAKDVDPGRWAEARESVELGRVSHLSIARRRARRSLVVALVDRSSSRSLIARRRAHRSLVVALFVAQVAAPFARRALTAGDGRRPGRASSSAEAAGGRRASTTLWRLWRRGGSGAGGSDGRWVQRGATARRASAPYNERRRGRASGSAQRVGRKYLW